MFHKMKTIRSENYEIYLLEINKKSLSSFDNKRYICNNEIASFAYGHFLTYSKHKMCNNIKRWTVVKIQILNLLMEFGLVLIVV